MWQAYQYGHGKLRLVKDLKTGQAHLRVSLIDQEQIDNMGCVVFPATRYSINASSTTVSTTSPSKSLLPSRKWSRRRALPTSATRRRSSSTGKRCRVKNYKTSTTTSSAKQKNPDFKCAIPYSTNCYSTSNSLTNTKTTLASLMISKKAKKICK